MMRRNFRASLGIVTSLYMTSLTDIPPTRRMWPPQPSQRAWPAPKPGVACASRPGPRLGIVGAGQLARMLAQAASSLGCATVVLERERHAPAVAVATHSIVGDWNDRKALMALGQVADVVTLENEFVDADSLSVFELNGGIVHPGSPSLRLIQDKLRQREVLAAAGLPVPRFAPSPDRPALHAFAAQCGWPVMLKRRRHGYDGKGNASVRSAAGVEAAWQRLGGDDSLLLAEQFLDFRSELAVIVCRGRDGRMVTYPLVGTIQRDHICHVVKAPASVSNQVARRAVAIARRAVEAFGGVGCFGVELFLMRDGSIVINELAPRVHNSGHYTIEACECSQFENHVRAVLGWPLGATTMRAPAAVMINLLGNGDGPGWPVGVEQALAVPGAHIHLYGKACSARGRKMGHVTALGATVEEAMRLARRAARRIRFGAAA